ncbi:hypothetical protein F5Y02DRAFT_386534 [Annulohypoxylon stygium]|nr:hypothetical protein F5Y02DRAFT_386534 [Annulohypoxylon stygium]
MGAQHESYASTSASARSRKRKVHDYRGKSAGDFDYDHDHDHDHEEHKPKKSKKKAEIAEKRLRKFRPAPPQSFMEIYDRATSQRFYVLGRTRHGTPDCPEESVELTGSTGNIYVVHIAQQPTCTCPHSLKGNQCKHVIYVLSRVLRAPFNLVYQLALLTTELREIFGNAPPIDTGDRSGGEKHDKIRKSLEDDCPICFSPYEDAEEIVYCRATCGNNIHKECFETWANTKRKSPGEKVTCPMCRTPWQGDDDMINKIKNTGIIGEEGYVNVADQLGISGERDYSSYYRGPRRGARYGGWW